MGLLDSFGALASAVIAAIVMLVFAILSVFVTVFVVLFARRGLWGWLAGREGDR